MHIASQILEKRIPLQTAMLLSLTFFGFVHPCYRLLHSHSPHCECMANIKIILFSGVGGGRARGASAHPKILICWKSEQNPW